MKQSEYFKRSKVRNSDGNLLEVYHGTGTKIESFDPSFTGQGADQYGSWFYFTTDFRTALSYTTAKQTGDDGQLLPKLGGEDEPTVIRAYVDLENPILVNGSEYPNLRHIPIPNDAVFDEEYHV